jgi:anti-sigma factor RsiW
MIDCPNGEIRDRLPDFLHDQLDARARHAVAAHVAGCAACAAELALLREVRATLRSTPTVDTARIVAALRSEARADRGARSARESWRRLDWRIAAAIAVLAVGGGSAAVLSGRLREPEAAGVRAVEQPVRVQEVAAADLSIDADLGEASLVELRELLDDLESFDGLPAGDPEPPAALPATGEEGL